MKTFKTLLLMMGVGALLAPNAFAGGADFYTVHNAAVSLQWATQRGDDDCRRDADLCIERGRINTRDLISQLCEMESPPRDYRLSLFIPCNFEGGISNEYYLLGVWDRENEQPVCGAIDFWTRFAIQAENNNGYLREMRTLADSGLSDSITPGFIGPIPDTLSVTSVIRVAELSDRLFESEEMVEATFAGVDTGLEEESAPRCAASFGSNSVLGLLPEIEEEMESEANLEGGPSGILLIEKGRITGGRPFAIYTDFFVD